jgi:CheY-like chemotaxis protein
MARVFLFHWNEAEARERAARLARIGHQAVMPRLDSGADFKAIAARPPDAFVIDLSRLPSHGREVAAALRERKATRTVPIVFVDGAPEKIDRIRALLPDAVYTDWKRLRGALRSALRRPPAAPVVPGPMAGYSGTPLPKKLGIKPGSVVALRGAPRVRKTWAVCRRRARTRTAPRGTHVVVRPLAGGAGRQAAGRGAGARGGPGAVDRLAQADLGDEERPLGTARAGARARPRHRGLQDLRDRRNLVGTAVRETTP